MPVDETSRNSDHAASSEPAQPAGKPKPAGRHRSSWLRLLLIAALVFAADQTIKVLAFQYVAGEPVNLQPETAGDPEAIPRHQPVGVVPYVLSLRLTTNTGAVFGLGQGKQGLFVVVSLIATGVIAFVFAHSRPQDWPLHVALALILGGAWGNLVDRVLFHAVRDMFWLFPYVRLPFGLSWPGGNDYLYPWIFNLADAALFVGVALVFVVLQFTPSDEAKATESDGSDR